MVYKERLEELLSTPICWEGIHKAVRLYSKVHSDKIRGNEPKLKHGKFQLDARKSFFSNEGGQTLEQVVHRHCGISIIEDTQNLAGQVPEQTDLIGSTSSRRTDELMSRSPSEMKLFYDYIIFYKLLFMGLLFSLWKTKSSLPTTED